MLELYANFVLITINRIFANHAERQINPTSLNQKDEQSPQMRVNIKNSLVTLARNIEVLFLHQAEFVNMSINHMVDAI